jgi:hypothetical protein
MGKTSLCQSLICINISLPCLSPSFFIWHSSISKPKKLCGGICTRGPPPPVQWRTEGGFGGVQTPRNYEVLTKRSRTPSSVENTSVDNLIRIRVSLICKMSGTLTGGLPPPDPRSLYHLPSTEFVEPPPRKKILDTPLPPSQCYSYAVIWQLTQTTVFRLFWWVILRTVLGTCFAIYEFSPKELAPFVNREMPEFILLRHKPCGHFLPFFCYKLWAKGNVFKFQRPCQPSLNCTISTCPTFVFVSICGFCFSTGAS